MLDNYKVCCICGKVFEGYGNDPWPVREEGKCCIECNFETVIPARIKQLKKAENEIEEEVIRCVETTCIWNNGLSECICTTSRKNLLKPDKQTCYFFSED